VSETIEVRALIDRFLEHGRAFCFANGGRDEIYVGSADWMPRNFHRRVELMLPVEDPSIRARLTDMLDLQIADNAKSWVLQPDGKYEHVQPKPGASLVRCQAKFIEMTRDRVKAAEASATSGRFHLLPQRAKLDGKLPDGRRPRSQAQAQKKTSS
jgi:polyphosphate kinase